METNDTAERTAPLALPTGQSTTHASSQPKRDFWQEYVHSLNFFFDDPRWLAKLWVLPFFFWVPVVNLFGWWLLKAWQICAIRSIARDEGLAALNFSEIWRTCSSVSRLLSPTFYSRLRSFG